MPGATLIPPHRIMVEAAEWNVICRICLQDSENLFPIFGDDGKQTQMCQKIMLCSSIVVREYINQLNCTQIKLRLFHTDHERYEYARTNLPTMH